MNEGKPPTRTPQWWSRSAPQAAETAPPEPPPEAQRPVEPGAEPEPADESAADAAVPPVADAARPLHAPDPYSTPPYGGPGPWAPAPPVQRPQPTPAHGVHLPPAVTAPQAPRYDPWAAPSTPPPAAPPAVARRGGRAGLLAGALLLALLAGVGGGVVGVYAERNGSFSTVRLPQATAEQSSRRAEGSVAAIARAVLPGVVTIHVSGPGGQGTGTGFVLDERGHILTNHHVIEPAGDTGGASNEVQVRFHSGQTAEAQVVGGDAGYDLAVLRVDGVSGLHPLPLGNSDSVQVGDPVIAVGAPYDLEGTVTTGIISAKERPVTAGGETEGSDVSYVNALQTDASINPGNSGGPLVDGEGRVIGINSAIRSADENPFGMPGDTGGGSIGLGFAIPVNQAKRVAEELINTGRATHPVIGVSLDLGHRGRGARVAADDGGDPSVVPGGPADRAGIRAGDIITRVDGEPVDDAEELIVRIRSHRPGDGLDLTVERDDEARVVRLTLGSSDDD